MTTTSAADVSRESMKPEHKLARVFRLLTLIENMTISALEFWFRFFFA